MARNDYFPGMKSIKQPYHKQPFKPFNDCLLSLKGGANFEDETAPATEKRPKKPKNKTAESVERLISTHFSGFPLYQFRCCDVHRYNEIDTIQRCIPTL